MKDRTHIVSGMVAVLLAVLAIPASTSAQTGAGPEKELLAL